MAIDTKVTEEEIRKVYAEVVRGNVLSIVHRPSNRVVLQVVIYPQGDMAITHRFYMDLAKRLLKYCKEVYVDLYPNNRRKESVRKRLDRVNPVSSFFHAVWYG